MKLSNKKNIIYFIRLILSPYYVLLVLISFIKIKYLNKNISEKEYQAMISLFVLTGGRSNEILHQILKKNDQRDRFVNKSNADTYDETEQSLKKNGYLIKDNYLSDNDCSEILESSLKLNGYYKVDGNPSISNIKQIFDRDNPKGTMFYYEENDLINLPIIQKIISDPLLEKVAKNYFNSSPILSAVNMWWSSKFTEEPDSECAQKYHFDMDSLKWLKVFIYITDVGKKNGPHTFVKGSHTVGSLPYCIRKLGYDRIDDYQVLKNFGKDKLIEFDKSKGTLIFEDTKGLHKGKHVEEGDRLILQLEFTSTNFIKDTNKKINNVTISSNFLNFYNNKKYLMQFYQII